MLDGVRRFGSLGQVILGPKDGMIVLLNSAGDTHGQAFVGARRMASQFVRERLKGGWQ